MGHRLFPLVAAILLLAIARQSDAQTPGQTPPPLLSGPAPKPLEAPTVKQLSKQEADALIEKAFGKDSAEMKRPIRLWISDLGMAIAAMDAKVANDDGSVRFTTVSIGFIAEDMVLRGEQATLVADQPITDAKNFGTRDVVSIEIIDKTATVRLTPASGGVRNTRFNFAPRGTSIAPPEERIFLGKGFQPRIPMSVEIRFKFKVDPKASLTVLLPTPAKAPVRLPLWTNEDLAKVSELTFGESISKELSKHNAMEKTAHVMAKINHLNAKKRDGFLLAMIEQRSDLRGLPFLMGDDCRTREEQAKAFSAAAHHVHLAVRSTQQANQPGLADFLNSGIAQVTLPEIRRVPDNLHRATVAALMQILMPESAKLRTETAKCLATIPHSDATKALGRLAIFSPEDEVRAAAIDGLKTRRERDCTDILVQGFRYPLPAVSKRAAEALVKLERKDLLANLIEVLESPDPRLPVTEKRDGKDVAFVRELVKVNHHRNCVLCHAPGNTDNTPEGVLKVAVPLPSEPLPNPSDGGYQSTPPATPDIVVRLDMTYLRQDFSQMMPVSDAHPWPEMQRFDFLVRTRTLTAAEAQAYEECCEVPEPGRLSPYHRSALYALRELTGRDTEPTAAAWRKLLKLPAR